MGNPPVEPLDRIDNWDIHMYCITPTLIIPDSTELVAGRQGGGN